MNGVKHKVWIPGETVRVVSFIWFNDILFVKNIFCNNFLFMPLQPLLHMF